MDDIFDERLSGNIENDALNMRNEGAVFRSDERKKGLGVFSENSV